MKLRTYGILLSVILAIQARGAFLNGTTWEVEEGSSNNNGASFSPAVTGFPTDGAATVATGSSPVFTSASYNFVSGDVGAWLFIKSGTNWNPGFYKIASVASNAATLSAAVGAGVTYSAYQLTTVAGVATTASPSSATWGIDYSQQASPQFAFTDMVTASTTFTSVAHPVGVNFVGNGIQIISGSGCTAGFHTVISTSGTTATMDATGGTGTCTSNLGGAHGTLAQLNTDLGLTANITQWGFVKANSTYTVASGVSFNPNDNTKGTAINVNGYTTNRGDSGQATVQATSTGFTIITITNNNALNNFTFRNFILDCNSQTTSSGLTFSANGNSAANLKIENCKGAFGFSFNTFSDLVGRNILVTNYTGAGAAFLMGQTVTGTEMCFWCVAVGNAAIGFQISGPGTCVSCISANNTGPGSDGFQLTSSSVTSTALLGCVAYGNGRDGIRFTGDASSGSSELMILNSVIYGNAGFGFNNTGVTGGPSAYGVVLDYTGFGANTSGATNNQTQGAHDVTLSGDPFVNGASNNFALNNTAGAGTALRAAGFPGTLQTGGTGFLDIGALQSQVTGNGAKAFGFVGP